MQYQKDLGCDFALAPAAPFTPRLFASKWRPRPCFLLPIPAPHYLPWDLWPENFSVHVLFTGWYKGDRDRDKKSLWAACVPPVWSAGPWRSWDPSSGSYRHKRKHSAHMDGPHAPRSGERNCTRSLKAAAKTRLVAAFFARALSFEIFYSPI